MFLIALFTIAALAVARILRAPRLTWLYILAFAAAVTAATQLLPRGHPLRSDVAESSRNLAWFALGLVPVVIYALVLRKVRLRTGAAQPRRRGPAASARRGLVQIREDDALSAETQAALSRETAASLGDAPRLVSLGWRAVDGAMAGHLRLSILGGSAEILLMRVDEALRGTGIGTELLRGAETLARENAARRLHLRVGSWQDAGFFDHAGFRRIGTPSPGDGAEWIWMEKDLA